MVLFPQSTNFTIGRHSYDNRDGGGLTDLFKINSLHPDEGASTNFFRLTREVKNIY